MEGGPEQGTDGAAGGQIVSRKGLVWQQWQPQNPNRFPGPDPKFSTNLREDHFLYFTSLTLDWMVVCGPGIG